MGFLSSVHTLLVLPIFVGIFALAAELGYRYGRRFQSAPEHHRQQTTMVQGGLLGLLALLLGFSFALAVGRLDQRRQLVISEANAMGTAYLRAQLLAEPHRSRLMELLRQYAEQRLAFQREPSHEARFGAAEATALQLQPRMWGEVVGAIGGTAPDIIAVVAPALNDVIDLFTVRNAARYNHVPAAVIWMLALIAAVACSFVGYGAGLGGQRNAPGMLALLALVSLVIVLIVDLDRPRYGLITIDEQPLVQLVESLRQGRSGTLPP